MNRLIKFLLILWIGLAGVGLLSCSEKSCEKGREGYFIYLSHPYKMKNKWIHAYFIPEQDVLDIIDSLTLDVVRDACSDGYFQLVVHEIYGPIPKEFKQTPDIPVKVYCTLSSYDEYEIFEDYIDKIICITLQ